MDDDLQSTEQNGNRYKLDDKSWNVILTKFLSSETMNHDQWNSPTFGSECWNRELKASETKPNTKTNSDNQSGWRSFDAMRWHYCAVYKNKIDHNQHE